MSQISYAGAFNSATLSVPDVYLNVVAPAAGVVRPASIGVLGIRGVASWGPVDKAAPVGSLAQAALFGATTVRKWDLVTAAIIALQTQLAIGAGAGLMLSRASDGTDTAASGPIGLLAATAALAGAGATYAVNDIITLTNGVVIKVTGVDGSGHITSSTIQTAAATSQPSNPVAQATTSGSGTGATFTLTYSYQIKLTSVWTGSAANAATATIAAGSAANTWKITIQMPGFVPEVFDNIMGSGNALWIAMANAINNGNTPQRGPSQLVVATAGALTSSPTAGTIALSGGTDGTGSITSSVLVGSESGGVRTGIYSFRATGISDGMIADFDDHTQESTFITFAQSEGILWHTNGPAGESVASAQSAKSTNGIDNPWLKSYLGDWNYWNDNINGQQRLLGPATFGAAVMSTLAPQDSGLNKQSPGVAATQRSKSGNPYSNFELASLVQSSIEVICNPIPQGAMFGLRIGRNASSDATRNTDNWPRLTSFIAHSLAGPGALGPAIGQVVTDDFFTTWYDVLDNFLAGLQNAAPTPVIENYQINFSRSNNPQNQTAQGLVVAEVLIQYFGIAQVFLVNLQTGATVVIPVSASSFALAA